MRYNKKAKGMFFMKHSVVLHSDDCNSDTAVTMQKAE